MPAFADQGWRSHVRRRIRLYLLLRAALPDCTTGPPSRFGSPIEDDVATTSGLGKPSTMVERASPAAAAPAVEDTAEGGLNCAGLLATPVCAVFAAACSAASFSAAAWAKISRCGVPQSSSTSAVFADAVTNPPISRAFARPCSLSFVVLAAVGVAAGIGTHRLDLDDGGLQMFARQWLNIVLEPIDELLQRDRTARSPAEKARPRDFARC